MNNKTAFYIGVLGVSLFTLTSIIGGLLIDNYSIVSQYISETYAIDTEYGVVLRVFGHIPSGILITIFCFVVFKYFPPSKLVKIGFSVLGILYGVGTVIVAVFPCDSGCNKELIDPSISQIIHNLTALFIYAFVPLSIIVIGLGLRKVVAYKQTSIIAIILGIVSMLFVYILISEPTSEFIGLYQRIIELLFVIWILICAFKIKNMDRL